MPLPLWLLGAGAVAIAGLLASDSDDDDDYDRDYERRQAARRARERQQAAEEARREEQAWLAREREQLAASHARQQIENLVRQYDLSHRNSDELTGLARSNPSSCKSTLLGMYDSAHPVDDREDCDQQAIARLKKFCVLMEK